MIQQHASSLDDPDAIDRNSKFRMTLTLLLTDYEVDDEKLEWP